MDISTKIKVTSCLDLQINMLFISFSWIPCRLIYYTSHVLKKKLFKGKCRKASAERQVSLFVA